MRRECGEGIEKKNDQNDGGLIVNEFLRRIDDTARDSLRRIETANRALKRAEKIMRDANGSKDERRMLSARSYLLEAQDEVRNARKNAEAALDGLRGVRAEAVDAAVATKALDPDAVDMNGVKLLESGLCRPADLAMLAKKYSGNMTMLRLVGKFAAEAANGEKDDPTARIAFNTVAVNCDRDTNPERAADGVDVLLDVFRRSINNPAMIREYDALTYPVTGRRPSEPMTGDEEE